MAVTDGDGVYGLPYVVEGYGIIYNNAIMSKYFASGRRQSKSMDEVNNFAKLKAVVEDMTAKKAELGIKGRVFFHFSETRRRLALADASCQCPGFL